MEQLRNLFKFVMSNTILCIVLGLLAFGAIGGVAGLVQNHAKEKIMELQKQNAALEAQVKLKEDLLTLEKNKATQYATEAAGWKGVATDALAKLGKLETRLKKVEIELANMPRPVPPTDVTTLPATTTDIAAAFNRLELPAIPEIPSHQGADVGFSAPVAQKVLAYTMDGINYPTALVRAELLEEKAAALEEKANVLEEALGAKTKEASSWEAAYNTETRATKQAEAIIVDLKKEVSNDKEIIHEKDKVIRTEKVKKWTWGGGGILLGLLIVLL